MPRLRNGCIVMLRHLLRLYRECTLDVPPKGFTCTRGLEGAYRHELRLVGLGNAVFLVGAVCSAAGLTFLLSCGQTPCFWQWEWYLLGLST